MNIGSYKGNSYFFTHCGVWGVIHVSQIYGIYMTWGYKCVFTFHSQVFICQTCNIIWVTLCMKFQIAWNKYYLIMLNWIKSHSRNKNQFAWTFIPFSNVLFPSFPNQAIITSLSSTNHNCNSISQWVIQLIINKTSTIS